MCRSPWARLALLAALLAPAAVVAQQIALYSPLAGVPGAGCADRPAVSLLTRQLPIPLAAISAEDVRGVRAVIVPLSLEPGFPVSGARPEFYRVIVDLGAQARRQLRDALESGCRGESALALDVDGAFLDVPVTAPCTGAELRARFGDRESARRFAAMFSATPLAFFLDPRLDPFRGGRREP